MGEELAVGGGAFSDLQSSQWEINNTMLAVNLLQHYFRIKNCARIMLGTFT